MRRQDDVFDPDSPVEPPTEPPDAFVVELAVSEPAPGQELTGHWNGVTFSVGGTARIASGSGTIQRVEVSVGGGEFTAATATAAGWTYWTTTRTVTSSGTQTIVARAIDGEGHVASERTVTITTTLAPKPPDNPEPPADTTAPTVTITTPAPGETLVLDGAGRAEVTVTGTASDAGGSGLDRVELTVDGAPIQLTPGQAGWTNWTGRALLTGDSAHTISATAHDQAGLRSTAHVSVATVTEPPRPPAVERLMVVTKCRLSTYLGAYGTGSVVKTVCLLPGENTEIEVKSYRRSSEKLTEASSILDSTSSETESSFEQELQLEQSSKRASAQSLEWTASGSAAAGWGWGSASVSAGVAGNSNAALEEMSKSFMKALGRHAAKASAKREVQINTTREITKEEGEEASSKSKIENINLSRTLNFIFRQMNQEYLSILHLVDVRVAYVRGDETEVAGESEPQMRWTYQEATLSQLDGLLRQVIVPERREDVRRSVINVLTSVSDHEDELHSIVEERTLQPPDGTPRPSGRYLRFPKGKVSVYEDASTGTTIKVPGVILAVTRNILRTDGVIADAMLGQGEALDAYNKGLQTAVVKARTVENARESAALDKDRLAIEVVRGGDTARAKVFRTVYPPPRAEGLALATVDADGDVPATNGTEA
jgi:hypothetical protein